jgi:hypothetical protein
MIQRKMLLFMNSMKERKKIFLSNDKPVNFLLNNIPLFGP